MVYQSIVSPAKMGDRAYVYNRLDAANYAAFAPITWCIFFGWIIFTSYTGNGGKQIFNWYVLQIYGILNLLFLSHANTIFILCMIFSSNIKIKELYMLTLSLPKSVIWRSAQTLSRLPTTVFYVLRLSIRLPFDISLVCSTLMSII